MVNHRSSFIHHRHHRKHEQHNTRCIQTLRFCQVDNRSAARQWTDGSSDLEVVLSSSVTADISSSCCWSTDAVVVESSAGTLSNTAAAHRTATPGECVRTDYLSTANLQLFSPQVCVSNHSLTSHLTRGYESLHAIDCTGITGAALSSKNTSSEQLTTKYGRH